MIETEDFRDRTIAELRQRLAEAEDTIAAIRTGEVDALVVQGAESDEIFTIEDDSAYRSFIEAMDPGAIALDSSTRIIYANGKALELIGRPLASIQGQRIADVLDSEQGARLDALLSIASEAKHTDSLVFSSSGGLLLNFDVSASPLRIGAVYGHALIFTDVTERVRAEAAEQNERAARAIIASANEAVVVCDREGVVTHANLAARSVYDGDLIGMKFVEAVDLRFPASTGLLQTDDVVSMALAGNATQGMEATVPEAPKIKDYLVSVAPLRVAGDQISGCVITMVDLSQRKAAEKHQLLLMAELDHRVKNTLALVQSISSRTLSNEDSLVGYQAAFSGRLRALAATHNLLAERSWQNLRLSDVIAAELAPYVERGADRVRIEGLEIPVSPRAAIALGLILHELTTNAVKYGALSGEDGSVTVTAVPGRDSGTSFVFQWQETGGPRVGEPTRKGFGKTVIDRSLQYSPNGGTELLFEPAGVVCRISVPLEDVAPA
jgi:PAS domain S-box-containing protein